MQGTLQLEKRVVWHLAPNPNRLGHTGNINFFSGI
jgi:hypothetical protein